jgi:hypothetical protein
MTNFERLSLLATFLGILVNVVLFSVLVQQLRVLGHQVNDASRGTRMDHERRRKQATVEFYTSMITNRPAVTSVLPYDRDAAAIAEFIERAKVDSDLTTAIREHLSLHELLATGIRTDVFDFTVIWLAAGNRIIDIVENYGPWIEERRRILGQPALYLELEMLAKRMHNFQRYNDPANSAAVDRALAGR